uniref:Uncharacterized protein n=3 Tax=Meloidogyne TaxID=189290 RepID=A0A6V7V6E7_MELEN|nr:unnamed protein product [Meloidogyne enterolobii]
MDGDIHPFILFILLFFVSGSLMMMFCSKKKPHKEEGMSKKLRAKGSKGPIIKKDSAIIRISQAEKDKKSKAAEKHHQPAKPPTAPPAKPPEQKISKVVNDVVAGVGVGQHQKADKTSEETNSFIKKADPKKMKKMRFNSIEGPSLSLHGSLATSGDGTVPKTDDMLAENSTDPAFEKSNKKISAKGKQGEVLQKLGQAKKGEMPVQAKGKKIVQIKKMQKKVVVPRPPIPAGLRAKDSIMIIEDEKFEQEEMKRMKKEKKEAALQAKKEKKKVGVGLEAKDRPEEKISSKDKVDQSKDKTKEKKKKVGAHAGGLEAKDSMIDQPEEGFSSKDEGPLSLEGADNDEEDEEMKEEAKGKPTKEPKAGKSEVKSSKESNKDDENSDPSN